MLISSLWLANENQLGFFLLGAKEACKDPCGNHQLSSAANNQEHN